MTLRPSFFLCFETYKAVNNLAIKYTEKRVVNIPIPNVKEKPLIGPEPIKNKIIAAISVVIFASRIAVLDFVYPLSNAIIVFFIRFF